MRLDTFLERGNYICKNCEVNLLLKSTEEPTQMQIYVTKEDTFRGGFFKSTIEVIDITSTELDDILFYKLLESMEEMVSKAPLGHLMVNDSLREAAERMRTGGVTE